MEKLASSAGPAAYNEEEENSIGLVGEKNLIVQDATILSINF